jgi:hypothetical protein
MANDTIDWNYLAHSSKLFTDGYTNLTGNQSDASAVDNETTYGGWQVDQQHGQVSLQNYSDIGRGENQSDDGSGGRLTYEGSSFMLLFEDFGEYFYNYNGTGYNETTNGLAVNCSLANSTCEPVKEGEY